MRRVTAADLDGTGLEPAAATALQDRANAVLARHPEPHDGPSQVRLWNDLRGVLVEEPAWRWAFEAHRRLFRLAYEGRAPVDGPAPAWTPTPAEVRASNLSALMARLHLGSYEGLHRWSVAHREEFWALMIRLLHIRFAREPMRVLEPGDPRRPEWLPGAQLNIAESCFRSHAGIAAIVHSSEDDPTTRRVTFGGLRKLSNRVANGLEALGLARGDRVALYMPMTPESVAIYLGVILAGRTVVGIADTSAPAELDKRLRIGGAKAVFTIDGYRRGGRDLAIYEKVVAAKGPRAIVLPAPGGDEARAVRPQDLGWDAFLSDREEFEAVACRPGEYTNILFSSGTTKNPKAIPWSHATPIKSAADAYLHYDTKATDVLAWPTSFGWMMGPWLTYASFVNEAAMALYVGAPQGRGFGEFVERAGVTILGVVPKLVRAWRERGTMEGLDWRHVRLFGSTAEPSTPEEMLYLMYLAGYKPIIEYCGGTEIGGGYLTGTVVQPCAPGTFTTPALGLDLHVLDDGAPAERGEVFLVPPSLGLSTELLNYDHDAEYYEGVPRGPSGEALRRHGDQIERLGGGFYRHHGRIDDTINLNGVKTSAEEIRSVIAHDRVYDAKPVAVDLDGTGQHVLIVFAVPRDPGDAGSEALRERLRLDYARMIRERLNPLLAHVHDVVLVPELPQAGSGKTRTMRSLASEYQARRLGHGDAGGEGGASVDSRM